MNEIVFLPAHELARAIRERRLSSREIVEAHLRQIKRYNPGCQCDCDPRRRGGRAARAGRPMPPWRVASCGDPCTAFRVTVKDTFETAGLRTTSSYHRLIDYVPQQDAGAVARLRQAGAIVLGKTNVPKQSMDIQTVSPIFGRTNNPWDLDRTPGGSTGGGAAAVAAGMSPLELGSDLGGSIRIPAHFCGILGLKPTDNLVPHFGPYCESAGQTQAHPPHAGCRTAGAFRRGPGAEPGNHGRAGWARLGSAACLPRRTRRPQSARSAHRLERRFRRRRVSRYARCPGEAGRPAEAPG